MDEVLRTEEEAATAAGRTPHPVHMVLGQRPCDDALRYNSATANEVAVIYVGDEEDIPGKRHLDIRARGGPLKTISYLVQGLQDYIIGDPDHSGAPGRRVILGASFSSGPRNMGTQYQDAMTIVFKKVFGEVTAYIYVTEFQKRGLAHMHMLITLKDGWKVNTAAQVDSLISAELPCATEYPDLFDNVPGT
ncbi:unnamed protein product [Heligmosomoides polygyrus]|uniref:Helitron_like_N domain-containing protein n=1 Tax=Heligmosomoides polygyrus TaxID=6339 RepID=A0A3P7YKL1_HELPZ|nr:unnamed protein product [Heligmosomoides polygyrus]